jgi:hypothetical protein
VFENDFAAFTKREVISENTNSDLFQLNPKEALIK